MQTYSTLLVETDPGGIVHLTLNRPQKRNALSATMIEELTDFARSVGSSLSTRAVILSGAGEVFCAGGDLGWMQAQIAADRVGRMREARKLAEMLDALNRMPAPLIGYAHGGVFGGGIGLLCVCDLALAADDTRFGLTETGLGLIPATIGPYVVARMGEGYARRIFMSSRIFAAPEARDLGIIARSVPREALAEAAATEALPYLSVAPGAVGAAKALARRLGPVIDDAVLDATIEALADVWETAEAREGISAFLEKRPPKWKMQGNGGAA
ncbi:crotonase/enoyl-CoA hydratase family protein [Pseudotabrizicola sp. 4114]|uniref:crotonase/enoyl-CoA hydratase family protein n=1 Tax=Pseudotabrizicola sp. 4114 TaxID=2817731 RepID=UPI0032B751B3